MVNHLSYDVQSYSFWQGGQALWFLTVQQQTKPWASRAKLVVKNPPVNARDREAGSISALGKSPGWRCGNPLQDSCLENPVERGACQATVHRVSKSWMQLKQLSMQAEPCSYSKIITFFSDIIKLRNKEHQQDCSGTVAQTIVAGVKFWANHFLTGVNTQVPLIYLYLISFIWKVVVIKVRASQCKSED